MAQYYITSEMTEDRFDCTNTIEDAIQIAREVALAGQAGDPVCIEHDGKNILQFVLLPDGNIAEESLV